MGMSIDNTYEPKPMSKEEIVDTLKTMVFGVQAFERFNAKERETLDKAWNLINQYETCLKTDLVTMLEEIRDEIASNYLIDADTGKIISGILPNFKAQKLLDRINNEIDKVEENEAKD